MSVSRTLSSTVSNVLRITSRQQHFLANVPLKKRGVEGTLSVDKIEGKQLLLYFSAGWCRSCKMLTPKLKKFHEGLADPSQLEVIWVSRDKEENHQLEYYEKAMPDWAFVPYGDENIKNLLEKFDVKTIPALKLVNEKGEVLSERARADVEGCVKDKSDPMNCLESWKEL